MAGERCRARVQRNGVYGTFIGWCQQYAVKGDIYCWQHRKIVDRTERLRRTEGAQ